MPARYRIILQYSRWRHTIVELYDTTRAEAEAVAQEYVAATEETPQVEVVELPAPAPEEPSTNLTKLSTKLGEGA
jgi:hypothetical protein